MKDQGITVSCCEFGSCALMFFKMLLISAHAACAGAAAKCEKINFEIWNIFF